MAAPPGKIPCDQRPAEGLRRPEGCLTCASSPPYFPRDRSGRACTRAGLHPSGSKPLSDDRQDELDELERRIRAARQKQAPPRRSGAGERYNAASLGWRMAIELVLGVLIGSAMGYGIDWLAGTLPVFLVIFGLLGFAAGVRTMMRSAREVTERQARRAGDDDTPSGG